MSPSLNSTLVTKPPTRALTCTSSIASNRPVNLSQSVTARLTACATLTGSAGGAAAAAVGFCSQPPSANASASAVAAKARRPAAWKVFLKDRDGSTTIKYPLLHALPQTSRKPQSLGQL